MTKEVDFDPCLETLGQDDGPGDLSSFLGSEDEVLSDRWQDHWKGMPEFEQEDKKPFKRVTISFRTREDYLEFQKVIDQQMTEKTKSIWYPALEAEKNSLNRWFVDEE
jgi:hypothetical protein